MGVAMTARHYDVIVIGAGSTGENVGPTTTFSQQEGRMCLRCADTGHVDRPVVARRGFLKLAGGAAVGFAVAGRAFAEEAKRPPKPENVISPDAALERLMKGNQRYVEGVARRHDLNAEREALSLGQNPFAGILSGAAARVAPEY